MARSLAEYGRTPPGKGRRGARDGAQPARGGGVGSARTYAAGEAAIGFRPQVPGSPGPTLAAGVKVPRALAANIHR